MTPDEARKAGVCRLCKLPLLAPKGQPKDWWQEYGEMIWPTAITLRYGEEYAHTECVKKFDAGLEVAEK